MHNQYINLFIDLPEIEVQHIWEMDEQTIHIQICPRSPKQACPICRSDRSVIRKGSNGIRKIRHTNAWETIQYGVRAAGYSHRVGFHRQAERTDPSHAGKYLASQISTMVIGGKWPPPATGVE
ncbi:hypothetical protein BSNK01_17970 [Bacillaceae bacterium]